MQLTHINEVLAALSQILVSAHSALGLWERLRRTDQGKSRSVGVRSHNPQMSCAKPSIYFELRDARSSHQTLILASQTRLTMATTTILISQVRGLQTMLNGLNNWSDKFAKQATKDSRKLHADLDALDRRLKKIEDKLGI